MTQPFLRPIQRIVPPLGVIDLSPLIAILLAQVRPHLPAMTADWLRESGGRTTLTLHIQPGAKKTEVAGLHGDALKIRLARPHPVDGKANAALLSFVAERLGIAKSSVSLKSGQTSRRKVLEIDAAPADIAQRLLPES